MLEGVAEHPLLVHGIGRPEAPMKEEQFVCHLYGASEAQCIDIARLQLFFKAKKGLPPTQDALQLHIARASYQATIWLYKQTNRR